MKKAKLLKSILVPTLGISAIGTIAAVSTSCGSEKNIENQYVAITANENSTLTLNNKGENNPDLQYSTDRTNWSAYNTTIDIPQGLKIYLKGNNPTGWSQSRIVYSYLSITGSVSINGNVMGLLDNGAAPGKEGDITTILCDYCFIGLFENSTGIKSVSEDFLPATILKSNCYNGMFSGCSSLETAPNLPATTLADSCYYYMFCNCFSLTKSPALPATNLAENCYGNMFSGCSSLTIAPELPATNLTEGCYNNMFCECTSLTTAPKLPATTLADYCYDSMFLKCTSLTTAPELPATTLTPCCYAYMFWNCTSLVIPPDLPAINLVQDCYAFLFYGCKKLNSIKIGYTGDYDSIYFNSWVLGVANSGTFYYNGTTHTAQDFGLNGWTTKKF